MLRYGLSFEDIEWANQCVDAITEEEIVFNGNVDSLTDEQRMILEPYLHD